MAFSPPACTDCLHHSLTNGPRHRCVRLCRTTHEFNRVIGGYVTAHEGQSRSAFDERYSVLPWRCGKRARYFVLKVAA